MTCLLAVHGYSRTDAGQIWGLFRSSVLLIADYVAHPINIDQHHEGKSKDILEKLCIVLCQLNCVGVIWDEDVELASWPDALCIHLTTVN